VILKLIDPYGGGTWYCNPRQEYLIQQNLNTIIGTGSRSTQKCETNDTEANANEPVRPWPRRAYKFSFGWSTLDSNAPIWHHSSHSHTSELASTLPNWDQILSLKKMFFFFSDDILQLLFGSDVIALPSQFATSLPRSLLAVWRVEILLSFFLFFWRKTRDFLRLTMAARFRHEPDQKVQNARMLVCSSVFSKWAAGPFVRPARRYH